MVLIHGHLALLIRELLALRLCIAVMQGCKLRALRIGFTMMLSGFRASHLDIASMIFISLASEVWTLLSDDLFLVIFRQST